MGEQRMALNQNTVITAYKVSLEPGDGTHYEILVRFPDKESARSKDAYEIVFIWHKKAEYSIFNKATVETPLDEFEEIFKEATSQNYQNRALESGIFNDLNFMKICDQIPNRWTALAALYAIYLAGWED